MPEFSDGLDGIGGNIIRGYAAAAALTVIVIGAIIWAFV